MSFVSLSSDMLVWRGTGSRVEQSTLFQIGVEIIQKLHTADMVYYSFSSSSTHAHPLNVQNAVVESTSIVGTIEAINLRNTTR